MAVGEKSGTPADCLGKFVYQKLSAVRWQPKTDALRQQEEEANHRTFVTGSWEDEVCVWSEHDAMDSSETPSSLSG